MKREGRSATPVRKHPSHQHTTQNKRIFSIARMRERRCALCPEVAIMTPWGSCRVHLFLLLRWLGRQHMCRRLVRCVDVRLGRGHRRLDRLLSFVLTMPQDPTDLVIAQETSLYTIDGTALTQNHSENSLDICTLWSSRDQ